MPTKGEKLEVQIESLSFGGAGIARVDGMVVFIPFVVPQDVVEIEITTIKKNFAEGRVLRVLSPSNYRVDPRCKVFGVCGGCDWQNVSYEQQLLQKKKIVQDALVRIGKLNLEVQNLIPSPNQWNYRNRIQVHRSKDGFGFQKRGTHEVVTVQSCPIAKEEINFQLAKLSTRSEVANRVELRVTGSPDGGFSQVNSEQNLQMLELVKSYIRNSSSGKVENIFDLYGGSGNFAFALHESFDDCQFIVVELGQASIETGIAEATKRKMSKQIRFVHNSVDKYLAKTPTLKARNSTAFILDPPRNGLEEAVILNTLRLLPQTLIYVSCNPTTLARDLARLSDRYLAKVVQPIDMFPHTAHIETVVWLECFQTE